MKVDPPTWSRGLVDSRVLWKQGFADGKARKGAQVNLPKAYYYGYQAGKDSK